MATCLFVSMKQYPYIDIERAAMWGHSGGGFITADAMFRFPDFFKVGISESGNHDQRLCATPSDSLMICCQETGRPCQETGRPYGYVCSNLRLIAFPSCAFGRSRYEDDWGERYQGGRTTTSWSPLLRFIRKSGSFAKTGSGHKRRKKRCLSNTH